MVLKYSQLTNVLQLQSDTKICDITAHEFMAKQDVFLPAVLGQILAPMLTGQFFKRL